MTFTRSFGAVKAGFWGVCAPVLAAALATPALAETLNIVTSIAPVQGIVAEISAGRQTPELLVPAGADPHDFALRPSQIRALQGADIIVLMGNEMEPWWHDVAGQIGAETEVIVLGETPLVAGRLLMMRSNADVVDPHIWLDPAILQAMGITLADRLTALDADGRQQYQDNRNGMIMSLTSATTEIALELEGLHDVELVMGHDSLQYFETAFLLTFGGALTDSHGHEAGAHSVGEIEHIDDDACLVVDINEAHDHGHALIDGAPIARVDPLGSGLLEGADFSANLLHALAHDLQDCLNAAGDAHEHDHGDDHDDHDHEDHDDHDHDDHEHGDDHDDHDHGDDHD